MTSENVQPTDMKEKKSKPIIEEKITTLDGESYVKRYIQGKLLGKGGFASVYKVTEMGTTKRMAAKVIPKASLKKAKAQQKIMSEIQIHKSLQHPHIVQFQHVFEDKENIYILLELCSNHTLKQLVKRKKRLTEAEAKIYIHQLVDGLRYIHRNGIIHRDLKLGNIFLNDKMELKIGDFGLSARVHPSGGKRKTLCGTPNYIAPEILLKLGHSIEADIWSFGVICYTLLVGSPPFETSDLQSMYKKIQKNDYSYPEQIPLSETAKDFVNKLLVLDPSKRMTCDEILTHPFLDKHASLEILKPKQSASSQELPPIKSPQVVVKKAESENKVLRATPEALGSSEALPVLKPSAPAKVQLVDRRRSTRSTVNRNGGTRAFVITTTKGPVSSKGAVISEKNAKDLKRSKVRVSNALEDTAESDTKVPTQSEVENNQDVVVLHWVEYTKYGMSYLLSNGLLGMLFNDTTTMLMNPQTLSFDYIVKNLIEKKDIVATFNLNGEYPEDLQKKVKVINHFRELFENNKIFETKLEEYRKKTGQNNNKSIDTREALYIKKWMNTNQAALFHFNNKKIQVNFKDNTQLTVNRLKQIVSYTDAENKETLFGLEKISLCENDDVLKRLKYTQGMLKHAALNAEKAM